MKVLSFKNTPLTLRQQSNLVNASVDVIQKIDFGIQTQKLKFQSKVSKSTGEEKKYFYGVQVDYKELGQFIHSEFENLNSYVEYVFQDNN